MPIDIKAGDWIVYKDYDLVCRQATKVTTVMVYCVAEGWRGPRRLPKHRVIFSSGNEATARRVLELLKSSKAQYDEECSAAYSRKVARDEKIKPPVE